MEEKKLLGKLPEGKERLKILENLDKYFSTIKEDEEKIKITNKKNKKVTIKENKEETTIILEEKKLLKKETIKFKIPTKELKNFIEFLKKHDYKEYKEDSYYKITYKNEDENSIIDENTILTLKLNTIIGDYFEIKTNKKTKKNNNAINNKLKKEEEKNIIEHLKKTIEFLNLKEDKNVKKEYEKKLKETKTKKF